MIGFKKTKIRLEQLKDQISKKPKMRLYVKIKDQFIKNPKMRYRNNQISVYEKTKIRLF